MTPMKELALRALNDALRMRTANEINLITPLDIFQFASDQGIEVRFFDVPSLEAMYVKMDPPRIIISAQRPSGRQVFNCAHELGHHFYGHGSRVDEYFKKEAGKNKFSPEEFIADRFASFLLMPKSLVNFAFTQRGWKIPECSVVEFFTIAGWIGVGYTTLITHMRDSLYLLTPEKAQELLRTTPKSIRQQLVPGSENTSIIIIDYYWAGRAIDAQVGDFLILPPNVQDTSDVMRCVSSDASRTVYQAVRPGIGRFNGTDTLWAAFLRVSKPDYVGRSIFRHLEDPEYA